MMSQLLTNLRRQLLTAQDPLVKAELLARIAANLARIGRFEEARQCVGELRLNHAGEKSSAATVWLMLAEGLIHLYSDLNPLALDRISRAQMLGLAMRYPAAIALSSAWKSHLEFENSRFDSMILSIRLGLQYAAVDEHEAQVRLAMVLANAFMIAGDRANSQVWFTKAREHAVKSGDQASLEALLYNRTAFGIASIRADFCVHGVLRVDLVIARKEVESTTNLQILTRVNALVNHIYLWSARLSILECRYITAIDDLEIARRGAPFADYNFSQQMIDLELAYCLSKLGRLGEALAVFEAIDLGSIDRLDLDERLVAASMQNELESMDQRFVRDPHTTSKFEKLKSKYSDNQSWLRSSLDEWARQ
jgi:tetratricopeptide (TPR) repeat protein